MRECDREVSNLIYTRDIHRVLTNQLLFGVLLGVQLTYTNKWQSRFYWRARFVLPRLLYHVNFLTLRLNLRERRIERWVPDGNPAWWVKALASLRVTYVSALAVPLFTQERIQMGTGERGSGRRWTEVLESHLSVKISTHFSVTSILCWFRISADN